MRILYACTQLPGNGGAATETYEAIKRLRGLGCDVTGLFIVNPDELKKGKSDPDGIGNIRTMMWNRRVAHELLQGEFDIAVAKNYETPWVLRSLDKIPKVYLTAGIDYITHLGMPINQVSIPFPPMSKSGNSHVYCYGGNDLRAFECADYVLVHSTLDLKFYKRKLPERYKRKIFGDVVYTPNISVPDIDRKTLPAYQKRKYDLCFSASDWLRLMKNARLMRDLCGHFKGRKRIVVCGKNPMVRGVETPGLIGHGEMIEVLKQTKIWIDTSWYDPSPNLYAEAGHCGCNVVISKNVGNAEGHPLALISQQARLEGFLRTIQRALALQTQLKYTIPRAEWAARQLLSRLGEIIKHYEESLDIREKLERI